MRCSLQLPLLFWANIPHPSTAPSAVKLYMVVRSADESHLSKQGGSSWDLDVTSRSIEEASIQIIIMAQIFDVISWCSPLQPSWVMPIPYRISQKSQKSLLLLTEISSSANSRISKKQPPCCWEPVLALGYSGTQWLSYRYFPTCQCPAVPPASWTGALQGWGSLLAEKCSSVLSVQLCSSNYTFHKRSPQFLFHESWVFTLLFSC